MELTAAVCPVCGSGGNIQAIETPADIGMATLRPPGTNTAWVTCPVCGFHGRHAVMCQDEQAAAMALYAKIGTLDDAKRRAIAYFNAGIASYPGRRKGGQA